MLSCPHLTSAEQGLSRTRAAKPQVIQVGVSNESLATLAMGNGRDVAARLALSDLRVQLLDVHGNAARSEGGEAQVRYSALQRCLFDPTSIPYGPFASAATSSRGSLFFGVG